ncbi:hypothetical protein M3Y99_01221600 [Aphelenchoides fujianensis]|nr:hypothetical protein M3Y99_01221600 [Aphelenchoides fujianensis]
MAKRTTAGGCRASPTDRRPPSTDCSTKSADFSALRSQFPSIRAHQICNTATVLWILPPHFSQSLLGGRTTPSSACALICCCVAEGLFRKGVLVPDLAARLPHSRGFGLHPVERKSALCPPSVLNILIEGIVEGNHAYELSGVPQGKTFNVPDALRATGRQMREVEWRSVDRTGAYDLLHVYLEAAVQSPVLAAHPQLFFVLLMHTRAILIVFRRTNGVIAAFDSHRHEHNGAYILSGRVDRLAEFAEVLLAFCFSESFEIPRDQHHFELSLIQFDGRLTTADCPLARPPPPVRLHGNSRIFPSTPVLQVTQRVAVDIVSTMKRFVHVRPAPDRRRRARRRVRERGGLFAFLRSSN